MFGHQDDQQAQDGGNDAAAMDALAAEITPDGGAQQQPVTTVQPDPVGPAAPDQPVDTSDETIKNALSPAGGFPKPPSQRVHLGPAPQEQPPQEEQKPEEQPQPEENQQPEEQPQEQNNDNENLLGLTTEDVAKGDLAALKIQALDELYPLIDKLDLAPEEKFRTLMMMIQASDNQELVKAAYEAAHSIQDEKAKAQALLDIVNEINYFTHQPEI
jgi:hypothetical protein